MKLSEIIKHHEFGSTEMTDLPYFYITSSKTKPHTILAGIWFDRATAESHLSSQRHNFGRNAYVFCASGGHSRHLKELYAIARSEGWLEENA